METITIKKLSTEQNLLRLLDMENAPLAEQEQVKSEFTILILEQVIASIEKTLPEDKKAEYERVFKEDADPEERALFLQENVPDLEQKIIEQSLRFQIVLQTMS